MTTVADPRDELIAELQRRLAEAEETLTAIRQGEVDALVVRGQDADEIFTIEGEAGYRDFMEAMDPGAVALDRTGHVLYATHKIAKLLRVPFEALQGARFSDVLDPVNAARFDALLGSPVMERQEINVRFTGETSDNHFDITVAPMRIGAISGYAVTFTDITERVLVEAAEQSERAARAVIASANEAVLVCDRDGVITHANAAARVVHDGPLIGRPFAEVVPLVFPGATGLMQSDDFIAMALAGTPLQGIEAVAPEAPAVKDYLVSIAPLRVAGDMISGCVITMVDLSQRKAAERQQLLLMAELDHRVKNTLALVQSISSRTLSSEDTLEGYQVAFSGRLQALSATHNLLATRSWNDLQLEDLLAAELAPYIEKGAGRVVSEGLDVAIVPRAAVALGLILHELTTNAVKYGALSNSTGIVSLNALPRDGDGAPFVMEWRETGGPSVSAPTRRGFGRTVISRSLQYSPHGKADLTFDPAGVICRISLPPEDVVRSGTA